jgi:L-malate glycosyltransferase
MNPKIETAREVRILICIDSFYDGGAEMFAIRLANNLAIDAIVYFFALRPWLTRENKQKNLLDQNRVSVIGLTGSHFGDFVFKSLLRLSRFPRLEKMKMRAMDWRLLFVCKKHGIQIVNSHSWETDKAFAAVKTRGGFRLVSSFHGHYELVQDSGDEHDPESKRQLESMDAVVYLSPKHVATLDKCAVPTVKRKKIFYGVPFASEKRTTNYQSNEKLKLVMVARGIPEKGWAEALEAVAAINREQGHVITIDLLGVGEALDRLRQKYEGHTCIRFLGYCDNVLPFVKQAHIGLLPSYYAAESLPNSVIEYLICGKPVVATDAGAIREMITHNAEVAGIVLPLNNGINVSSDQIKDALLEYLRDPDKVARDSGIALRAAQKFQMETCVASYLKMYNSLLLPG